MGRVEKKMFKSRKPDFITIILEYILLKVDELWIMGLFHSINIHMYRVPAKDLFTIINICTAADILMKYILIYNKVSMHYMIRPLTASPIGKLWS